ncbi:MAG: FlgD immunoglobulin-like domain containing protein [Bacillota bacterium]
MRHSKNTCYLLSYFIITTILLINNCINPQEKSPRPDVPINLQLYKTENSFFYKIEGSERTSKILYRSTRNKSVNKSDFNYHLINGDKAEILVFKERVWTSRKKEVLNDTTLSNGIKYKIIEWSSLSNSESSQPEYEYQRIDSIGNVYTFYNNKDKLLYDFTKLTGETYPSQYPDKFWKVRSIYNVTGFNETLKAFDFELIDTLLQSWMIVTVIEKFGLTYLQGRTDISTVPIEQRFWGAIIDSISYGELLAFKNSKTDWGRYYPLHIGDMWKYSQPTVGYITTEIRRVIKDTVLYDGNTYKKIKSETFRATTPYSSSYIYERIDSNGNIFQYTGDLKEVVLRYRLSAAVGDTFNFINYGYYRIDNKYAKYDDLLNLNAFGLFMSRKRTTAGHDVSFVKDLGPRYIGLEGYGTKSLVGAVINGISHGDTARITTSVQEETNAPDDFALLENFPNPFNSSTKIRYRLNKNSQVRLDIYSVTGQMIKCLINSDKPSGIYEVIWDGKDEDGNTVSSGCYLLRLDITEGSLSTTIKNRKIALIK